MNKIAVIVGVVAVALVAVFFNDIKSLVVDNDQITDSVTTTTATN